MKLYLHCGYHKTGSSFLQSMFARNRDFLTKNGIWFPYSEREYDMLAGNISPGNGMPLTAAIGSADERQTETILEGNIREASKKKCEALLISSEGLFHAFAKPGALQCLLSTVEKLKIGEVHALVFFRDPIQHALSTYKHRGKNGNIEDFPLWLETRYETMSLLEHFDRYYSEYPIHWACRKYKMDSRHMADAAFRDWLNVETPEIPADDSVNTSLSLSEIKLIRTINSMMPEIIPFLYMKLSKIPKYNKEDDEDLILYYYSEASIKLKNYEPLILRLNTLFPENEKLNFISYNDTINSKRSSDYIILKEDQILAILEATKNAVNSNKIKNKLFFIVNKAKFNIKKLFL